MSDLNTKIRTANNVVWNLAIISSLIGAIVCSIVAYSALDMFDMHVAEMTDINNSSTTAAAKPEQKQTMPERTEPVEPYGYNLYCDNDHCWEEGTLIHPGSGCGHEYFDAAGNLKPDWEQNVTPGTRPW